MSRDSGPADASGLLFGVAAARFNEEISDRLLAGALEALREGGARDGNVTVVRVHGAFEVPQALALLLAAMPRLDALIGIGTLVRGETPHFDHLAASSAMAMQQLAISRNVPVANGIITCENGDQARARAGGARGNKGRDAALAAMEMGLLRRRLLDD